MMRALVFCAGALILAACGVDGAPTPPEKAPAAGLSISGTATVIYARKGRTP
jgi:hypothetical protein